MQRCSDQMEEKCRIKTCMVVEFQTDMSFTYAGIERLQLLAISS